MSLRRNLAIIKALGLIRLSRSAAERGSFWAAFFVDSSLFLTQAFSFWFIFLHSGSASDQAAWRAVFFVGSFTVIDGIYMASFFFGLIRIPELIRTGDLDLLLCKPGNSLVKVAFASVSPGSAALALPGCAMMALAAQRLGMGFSMARLGLWFLAMALMLVLVFDVMVLVRTPAFFIKRGEALQEVEAALMGFGFQVPSWTYRGPERIVFRYILPYGLIAGFPAECFLGLGNPKDLLAALAVVVGFSLAAGLSWRLGLSRYSSSGS